MILLIDNYDSFVYNLYQYLGDVTEEEVTVVRNDALTIDDIKAMNPSAIVISPGPGKPSDAGICEEVIRTFHTTVPILGICLGHQAIIESFGGTIGHAEKLMHGKSSDITVDVNAPVFHNVSPVTTVARYHSLVGKKDNFPDDLQVIAESAEGEIMAVMHKKDPCIGLQFHPESILTKEGHTMLGNYISIIKETKQ